MIGLFNDCFPPIMDGVSLTTQNYAYWLNKKVGDVCVITPKSPGVEDHEEYPIYRYSSIPIPMRKPYRLGFPRIDWPFHRQINQLSFDLVHAHCPFSSGNLAMCISKKQRIPIIATFHSKYRADFERAIPNKFLVDYFIKNVIKFYEMADEVWIPQATVEETLREYGYTGKVEIVDNGNDFVDKYSFLNLREKSRKILEIQENEYMFLFVGQHIWEKNLDFLLKVLDTLRDLPYKMYFIGSGYAMKELKEKVVELNLSSKIIFIGTIVDRERLKEYYSAADLFLFPSLYDNAPLVVREAAAFHVPSVLIKGSTSAEIVNDSYNGFLSENSVEAFSLKIRELLTDTSLVRKVGDRAFATIARSWENVAEEVYDRYKKLMDRCRKK